MNGNPPKQKTIFLINPISGGCNKSVFINSLASYALRYNFDYEILLTSGKNDLMHLRNLIRRISPEIVVAVGGDGTVLLAASALMHTEMSLGIVPFGSANGMATELKIPKNAAQAMAVIFEGTTMRIDSLKVAHRYNCIHIGDMGLNAKVVKRFEADSRRGLFGYTKQFFREILCSRSVRTVIITEHGRYVNNVHMIAFANAQKYGTGAVLNPLGKLNDGYFELCLIKSLSLMALFHIIALFTRRKPISGSPYMQIIRCKEARIILRNKKKLTVQVDGELIGQYSKLHIGIEHKCLKVSVPH